MEERMMTFETMITLNNGVQIPQLGYGTALISENQKEIGRAHV